MSYRRVSRSVYARIFSPKPSPPVDSARAKRVRIAIVEDQPVFARFLAALCTKELNGDIVLCETHGRRAMAQIRRFKPDLLLLDLSLPDVNALEVARRVRTQVPSVRILILSAYRDPSTMLRVRESGAHGFVDKRLQNRALLTEAIRRVGNGERYFGAVARETTPVLQQSPRALRRFLTDGDRAIDPDLHRRRDD